MKSGFVVRETPLLLMLNADTIKLIAPAMELIPAK